MRIGAYAFRPALWPSLATLLLLPALTGLGLWQLERASWKQALVDAHEGRSQLPPVLLDSLEPISSATQYRSVFVRGHYDMDHQLLLDNRTYQGRAGYHVLTPLRIAESDEVVLVNRGWIPLGKSRSELPELPGTRGEVLVNATLKLPPEKYFKLAAIEEVNSGWPKVVQQARMSELEQRLGVTLKPLVLLLARDDAYGFVRDWQPIYGVAPDKHRAYAVQWFALAAVLVMIYIGVNSKRISNK